MNRSAERALLLAQEGRIEEGIASLRVELRVRPRNVRALGILGFLLLQAGRPEESVMALSRAAAISPDAPDVRANLASGLYALGRHREAISHYEAAAARDPSFLPAWQGLISALIQVGDVARALAESRRAQSRFPDNPDIVVVMCSALEAMGRVAEAVATAEAALRVSPRHDRLRQRFLYMLNFVDRDPDAVARAHREFGMRGESRRESHCRDADPERRIRIGVLSGDFRHHAVGHFSRAIFAAPRSNEDLIALSTFPPAPDREGGPPQRADPIRDWFVSRADEWVECHWMDDRALASEIRRRNIDVLIELGGHLAHGRLVALESCPAPVSISAIGYPHSTGSTSIDWRLVDSITDPPGCEHRCSERLLRVDPCFLCYWPPEGCPEPGTDRHAGSLRFGSFNLASKVSNRTIRIWSDVLSAVPDSRLVLKSRWLSEPAASDSMLDRLSAAGLGRSRIEILGYTASPEDHLRAYGQIDVALDTTPYNGTTTTCEALWMGVPVVTLVGDRHAARVGASLLSASGLSELVAADEAAFVSIAARLAADGTFREEFRQQCRTRLQSSVLMDHRSYGVRFFEAVRTTWRLWCSSASRDGTSRLRH